MTNFVLVENGVVVQSDRTCEAEEHPLGFIAAPDEVVPGFLFDGEAFAVPLPSPPPVPEAISDRQFFEALAVREIITEAEALAAVKTGEIPAAMASLVDALPEASRFPAEMLLSGATEFQRAHPLTAVFGQAFGWTDAEIDAFWTDASAL
ncbi:hypothetical protein EN742_11290 [Mesorhizobium sp. M4A.F.Ca.ET.020.02.1.1]|uniref:hypothetical protein n=1 Tax=unclassified Mesorhizobium TaxID=325217 RepID=UPI000FD4726E|nr:MULTISPECIES: hypothetical protein [unclassified Mesorhizobium]RVD40991.1 hypothetical protein EN742_11290 [Mesorhizobium sp. M4A.F.Ca.ET.020.02.1.1]RWC20055.1 MAG: hypothetical protein EOS53_11080 [Mesorhizobium sp.]